MIDLVEASRFKGKKVVGAQGSEVGEVEGIELDLGNWKVVGLQVGLTNEAAAQAGFKRPILSQIVVRVPVELVATVGDVVMLKEQVKELKELVQYLGFRG